MTGLSSIGQVVNGFGSGRLWGKLERKAAMDPAAFVLLFMVLLLLLRDH
jgi:hypothetical protein